MTKTIPTYEKPTYEVLTELYSRLSELKNNRNKYISSKQVYAIYDEFLKEIHELSIVRKDEELKGMSLNLPTPTDLLIDDVWQLLSLSFVTCGLIKFAPATYSSLSTVFKLLTHLKECQVYSVDDLKPIHDRLSEIKEIIEKSEEVDEDEDNGDEDAVNHKKEESLLLRNKLNKCQKVYDELQKTFDEIPDDLEPIYAELILLRKQLLNLLTREASELATAKAKMAAIAKQLAGKLKKIEQQRDENGKFKSDSATEAQLVSAQMGLNGLLDDCNNLLNDLNIQRDTTGISGKLEQLSLAEENSEASTIFEGFKSLYLELASLKQKLENLLITRRWTMRETDLYNFQKLLKRIDDKRLELNKQISANCQGQALRMIKRAQLLVLYLLRRCYSLIYKLLESSEPVSESLQPIHNQLSTVRRCLLEIKRIDGLNNLRELYPFQFKLASLDNLRHDGKFIVNNQVPEGQGTLNALLAECFDIIHELKIELEEKEENGAGSDSSCDERHDGNITDEEDKESDDEVEMKRKRYMGFNEADYDMASESEGEYLSLSDSEFESNDYY
ncbi:CIC11C00000003683 [Sungouiella intermedia]|uniref:CIC11C00000003683 n=1 Tax=Sungouiella intermedia TaxID=45354 RepID=A0A1L0D690_9ASCO|nr:CIC11C00000003683 [[Candida] intermedia]